MHHYWTLLHRNTSQLECLNGGEILPLKLPVGGYANHPQYIMADNKSQAEEGYIKTMGIHVDLEETDLNSAVPVFRVVQ